MRELHCIMILKFNFWEFSVVFFFPSSPQHYIVYLTRSVAMKVSCWFNAQLFIHMCYFSLLLLLMWVSFRFWYVWFIRKNKSWNSSTFHPHTHVSQKEWTNFLIEIFNITNFHDFHSFTFEWNYLLPNGKSYSSSLKGE